VTIQWVVEEHSYSDNDQGSLKPKMFLNVAICFYFGNSLAYLFYPASFYFKDKQRNYSKRTLLFIVCQDSLQELLHCIKEYCIEGSCMLGGCPLDGGALSYCYDALIPLEIL